MKKLAEVFLCYARQDAALVSALYDKLSLAGFQPFMDTKDILPGEDWKQVLINTIRKAPFFLACLSNNSVDKRGVIQEEIREALEVWRRKLDSDIYLIPVRLEECRMPETLAKFQWVDLFQTNGFEQLEIALVVGMERSWSNGQICLRYQPLDDLHEDAVKLMLQRNDLYARDWNRLGKGILHRYQLCNNDELILDETTGLIWQQSGSKNGMAYVQARQYINNLNNQSFAGCSDWRLPTLEEAMSLMEATRKNEDFYKSGSYNKNSDFFIDSLFDRNQRYIWTSDKESARRAWYVNFNKGTCYYYNISLYCYVRAVWVG